MLKVMPSERPPMPFIVGVPRSGTTLLRLMLDSHPQLAIPPETGFLARHLSWLKFISPREALFRTVTQLPFKTGPWRDFGLDAGEFRCELKKNRPFDLSEGFRTFYRLYARNQNKPRYGDKNSSVLPALEKKCKTLAGSSFHSHYPGRA